MKMKSVEVIDVEKIMRRRKSWMKSKNLSEADVKMVGTVYAEDSACSITIRDIPILVKEIRKLRLEAERNRRNSGQ